MKAMVDRGWKKAGIICEIDGGICTENKYFLDNKEITRKEAEDYVKAHFKKIRTHDNTWYA